MDFKDEKTRISLGLGKEDCGICGGAGFYPDFEGGMERCSCRKPKKIAEQLSLLESSNIEEVYSIKYSRWGRVFTYWVVGFLGKWDGAYFMSQEEALKYLKGKSKN